MPRTEAQAEDNSDETLNQFAQHRTIEGTGGRVVGLSKRVVVPTQDEPSSATTTDGKRFGGHTDRPHLLSHTWDSGRHPGAAATPYRLTSRRPRSGSPLTVGPLARVPAGTVGGGRGRKPPFHSDPFSGRHTEEGADSGQDRDNGTDRDEDPSGSRLDAGPEGVTSGRKECTGVPIRVTDCAPAPHGSRPPRPPWALRQEGTNPCRPLLRSTSRTRPCRRCRLNPGDENPPSCRHNDYATHHSTAGGHVGPGVHHKGRPRAGASGPSRPRTKTARRKFGISCPLPASS